MAVKAGNGHTGVGKAGNDMQGWGRFGLICRGLGIGGGGEGVEYIPPIFIYETIERGNFKDFLCTIKYSQN